MYSSNKPHQLTQPKSLTGLTGEELSLPKPVGKDKELTASLDGQSSVQDYKDQGNLTPPKENKIKLS